MCAFDSIPLASPLNTANNYLLQWPLRNFLEVKFELIGRFFTKKLSISQILVSLVAPASFSLSINVYTGRTTGSLTLTILVIISKIVVRQH